MFRLSLIAFLFVTFIISSHAQSPHGSDLKLDCSVCHNPTNWDVDFSKAEFEHETTGFTLMGQHQVVDCKSCHTNLVFTQAEPECSTCHKDIHQETVGLECSKCHTSKSWIVEDINGLHQLERFPLVGNHLLADCSQCHTRYTDLYFEPLNIDCYSCHQQNYNSTSSPNHSEARFSTDCMLCHSINSDVWAGASIIHDFFPLVGGHAIQDCFACHEQGGNFTGLTQDCYSCHQQDYQNVQDPNHIEAGFPTDCEQCHTINEWSPANFDHHQTAFPLTGKHITTDCSDCHTDGFAGTPTDCYDCHQQDYEIVTDPNHVTENFPTDCIQCHTTDGWDGAEIDHNQTNFPLTGSHVNADCSSCHINGFTNTPTDCFSCHQDNYSATSNPDHLAANFPNTCEDCHTTTAWTPASFDHDGQFFPIYTGKHAGEWNNCIDCHTTSSDFSVFTCLSCHEHRQSEMDSEHQGINGYFYESNACLSCHPNGDSDGAFNHGESNFPLTGSHTILDCQQCHQNGYTNTPVNCSACHLENFNSTTNPNHQSLSLPTDCESCHSTDPNWLPASFPVHDQFYPLVGGHLNNANDCSGCHNGNYDNTPEQCFGCHQDNYNNAPEHSAQNYPTDCEVCHTVNSWEENSFDHTNTNFPLTGAHQGVDCTNCHESGYTGTTTLCYDCHQSNFEQTANPDHQSLSLPTDCESCHTTDQGWQPASFPIHNQFFELIGAHANISENCNDCHNGNFNNTPNTCFACHESQYNGVNDPPHQTLNFSHDCLECHNQNDWEPANFNHEFFPLSGDHTALNCNECHSQPVYQQQCVSCHLEDFLDEHNLGDPEDCWSCHTTFDWSDGNSGLKLDKAN
jgi:hypothetical protein